MPQRRPALGRGLSALIPEAPSPPRVAAPGGPPGELDLDLLEPNAEQPRMDIDEVRLDELAQSLKRNGMIQPILVRPAAAGRFEIVAGERRWRAAQRAGLMKVPVTIREVPDEKRLELALIENIQRENLNPIDEASAYRRLADEFGLTQEEIAAAVGKDRATVANYLRLLGLPGEVRADLASGALTMGHARAIAGLPDAAAQLRIAREVHARDLSVRETEALVKKETSPPPHQEVGSDRRPHEGGRGPPTTCPGHTGPDQSSWQGGTDRDPLRLRTGATASLRAAGPSLTTRVLVPTPMRAEQA